MEWKNLTKEIINELKVEHKYYLGQLKKDELDSSEWGPITTKYTVFFYQKSCYEKIGLFWFIIGKHCLVDDIDLLETINYFTKINQDKSD
jgi:hypothetical protein